VSKSSLHLKNALLPDGTRSAVQIVDGVIAGLDPVGSFDPEGGEFEVIDLDGKLLLPGLVEGHIHLDKCFIGDAWHPHRPAASIRERIQIEREELARSRPVVERARALVEQCVARGTSVIRTHVDIDPEIGLKHLHALFQVRHEYREIVDIQIVAFPQHGILVNPGTLELMAEAIAAGADLVGGLDPATFDGNVAGHLDAVFGLADRVGVPIDIHLHDPGELGASELELIAERTKALGMQGSVAVSHAYALGMVPGVRCGAVAERLAEAGVSIMTNAPGDHAFPPVLLLRRAGVTVFAGNDNVRDVWWPYGDADLLERAMMIGYRSGFYSDEELEIAFELVTSAGARALGLDRYGIEVGCPANLIAVEARHVPEAVVARPVRALVLHRGMVVARNGHLTGLELINSGQQG
jgi:cytosine/creatinine deaminase